MIKKFLPLLVLFLATVPALAETVDTAWVRRYNGPGNSTDQASDIVVDDLGNVYVTGQSVGTGTNSDYATIKYLPSGDTAWVRRYNGPGNNDDEAYALVVDSSGNVYVTGQSVGTGTNSDYATIKYLPSGDTAWVRRYNGPGNSGDYANAIAIDGSGNVYVTGLSMGSGTNSDYATIKYLPSGDTAWVRRYNGPGNSGDAAYAIAVDSSGNIYVTGLSYGSGSVIEYATIKYLPSGDTAWVRTYRQPGSSGNEAIAIAVDDSSNAYVTGFTYLTGYTNRDYLTVKYYSNGDTAWVRTYNGAGDGNDGARALAVDNYGNLYVTGYSTDGGTTDYATIKYLPDGDTAWVRRYDGPLNSWDVAYDIAIDDSGNVYVAGSSVGAGTSYDFAIIKYLPSGDTAWVRRHNGEGDSSDDATAVALDGSGNVYVTGYIILNGTHDDYCTIKYVQTSSDVKDEPATGKMPSEFTLSQNYPNPFNTSTKIEFALKNSGFVSLNIYDILGRKVRTLVSEDLSIGNKSIVWDGKDDSGKEVASGTYFYRLKIGDFSETKRSVLLK
jgi:uncharacterized protein (UPF0297 family)